MNKQDDLVKWSVAVKIGCVVVVYCLFYLVVFPIWFPTWVIGRLICWNNGMSGTEAENWLAENWLDES